MESFGQIHAPFAETVETTAFDTDSFWLASLAMNHTSAARIAEKALERAA